MNDYPLIGHVMYVDVMGSYSRAMLKDARHLAPEPCRSCPNLCLSRDELRNSDALHCKRPGRCDWIAPTSKAVPARDAHFVDVVPTLLGYLSGSSPCHSCVYKEEYAGDGGPVAYCNRRRDHLELCPVRGPSSPSEYADLEQNREWREAREAEQREAEAFDKELELIEAVDLAGYGSF